eukprot:3586486-Prymnesium_polylepis.1
MASEHGQRDAKARGPRAAGRARRAGRAKLPAARAGPSRLRARRDTEQPTHRRAWAQRARALPQRPGGSRRPARQPLERSEAAREEVSLKDYDVLPERTHLYSCSRGHAAYSIFSQRQSHVQRGPRSDHPGSTQRPARDVMQQVAAASCARRKDAWRPRHLHASFKSLMERDPPSRVD